MPNIRTTKMSQAFPVPGFPAGNRICPGTLIAYCHKGLSVPYPESFPGKGRERLTTCFYERKCAVPYFPTPLSIRVCVSPGRDTHSLGSVRPGSGNPYLFRGNS